MTYRHFLRPVLATIICLLIMVATTPAIGAAISVTAVQWSVDGRLLASGYEDGAVRIWDPDTGKLLKVLQGHSGPVHELAWSAGNAKLASSSRDKTIRIWDLQNDDVSILGTFDTDVYALLWNPQDDLLLSCEVEGPDNLKLWRINTSAQDKPINAVKAGSIVQMKWSPDRSQLALANAIGYAVIRTARNLEMASAFEVTSAQRLNDVYAVAWSPDGKRIASGSYNGAVLIWNLGEKQASLKMRGSDAQEWSFATTLIQDLVFSDEGRQLQSIAADGTIRLFDTQTGAILAEDKVNSPRDAAWSPYGMRVAVGSTITGDAASEPFSAAGGLEVRVPFVSLERISTLAGQCITDANARQSAVAALDAATLDTFVEYIRALIADQIPPACAADLIAAAEALQAK